MDSLLILTCDKRVIERGEFYCLQTARSLWTGLRSHRVLENLCKACSILRDGRETIVYQDHTLSDVYDVAVLKELIAFSIRYLCFASSIGKSTVRVDIIRRPIRLSAPVP